MLTESLGRFFEQAGAEWVLWLLLLMSVASVMVMIERLLFLSKQACDYEVLAEKLNGALTKDTSGVTEVIDAHASGAARSALSAAMDSWDDGASAIAERVASRITAERVRYERFLVILGTIAANAPFIGLLGTVIGVLNAFGQLAGALEGESRTELVMGSISEALVATAVGLAVAIPAVIAYNYFKRRTRVAMQEADALSKLVIARRLSVDEQAKGS